MGWGDQRFAKKPATATGYAQTLRRFFASQGDALDKNLKQTAIANGIRKASESGDLNAYRQWDELATRLLSPVAPADVYLNLQQAAARPKVEPFPGTLLRARCCRLPAAPWLGPTFELPPGIGRRGRRLLRHQRRSGPLGASATGRRGRALGHRACGPLRVRPGVRLGRAAEGFRLRRRQDLERGARLTSRQAVYRVDLQKAKPHARYVPRLERLSTDPAKPNTGRFHFRNFLVYGRPLY